MWACDPTLTTEVMGSFYGTGQLFTHALQSFLAAQCALLGDHLWPPDVTEAVLRDPNYDFIIVGAGSAGAVLANRLSEVSDWKILLIEAGGNPTLSSETPQFFFNNVDSPIDWGYKTQPQEEACQSYKTKGCAWPRGKVLGGCSSINGMYYVRANKVDYDEWAAEANPGWSYDEVLPYFKKSENFSEPLTTGEYEKYHGNEGFLSVEFKNDTHEFEMLIIKAAKELGIHHSHDTNGASQMGITKSATTTKDGTRHSTARAFLNPVRGRQNLHVMKNALVTKVLFKPHSNIVSGIIVNKNGKDEIINAKKEVIISAGAINTPQLLMLSGIGPQKHLKELGIHVKADLPVGDNLQDHPYVPMFYKLPGDKNMTSLPSIVERFSEYILERKGALSSTAPSRVISFINTTDSLSSSPDTQFHYVMFPPSVTGACDVYGNHGLTEEFQEKFREINEDNFVLMVGAVLLKPNSRGKIVLKNKDPYEYPLIHANYFKEPEDLQTVLRGIKQHSLMLAETETFKTAGLSLEWIDLKACKEHDKGTDQFLECWSRETTFSVYHPTSTVKMGPDDDDTAVLDNELKVRKFQGLRVIDASIMPKITRGNTNAPTIMIAEKGADMIKKFWLNAH